MHLDPDERGRQKVFDMESPISMLKKLEWEADLLDNPDTLLDRDKLAFATFNAAATAWHLVEWVIHYEPIDPRKDNSTKVDAKTYRKNVIERCPRLEICRLISIGFKHRFVSRDNDVAVKAMATLDIMIQEKGLARRTVQGLEIVTSNETIRPAALIRDVLLFWKSELRNLGFKPDPKYHGNGTITVTMSLPDVDLSHMQKSKDF